MPVTVDHEPLAVKELGLLTIGEVLSHIQKDRRLVVQILLDGQEPEPGQLGVVRQTMIAGHSLYIETADPRLLALEVLEESGRQLSEAERLKTEAAELLQQNQAAKAMEHLNACLRMWQQSQESITKTGELLRIDLDQLMVHDRPLREIVAGFSSQLRQIKSALEQRDFVNLSDVLLYETAQTTSDWSAAIAAMVKLIKEIR